ncbi:MAG: Fic family protein [Acidimicrobiia bacterium]
MVFAAHPHRRRVIRLPGATIVARTGLGPQPEDPPFRDGTRIASEPRALLENARKSRASRDLPPSTLSRQELADWIAELVNARGAERMGRLRDQMRDVADTLDLQAEYRVVDGLIGAALGTRAVPAGTSPAVHALHAGRGFDQTRVERFDDIAGQLAVAGLPAFTAHSSVELPFAFFEAYFSNFIEGTEFAVDEALEVVFQGAEPTGRPSGDAHDVRGTFGLVTDPVDRSLVPTDPDELFDLLLARHRVLMAGRPEHSPGAFKRTNNQAGGYVFVSHDLVVGTLEQAYSRALSLTPGAARAIYWLFAIAEIHPFSDGNGRIARVFANAELSALGLTRIIIPTVFRYEYLNALRLASNHGDVDALVKVCVFAQQWAAGLDFSTVDTARVDLEATNAFVDPTTDVSARLLLK